LADFSENNCINVPVMPIIEKRQAMLGRRGQSSLVLLSQLEIRIGCHWLRQCFLESQCFLENSMTNSALAEPVAPQFLAVTKHLRRFTNSTVARVSVAVEIEQNRETTHLMSRRQ